MRRDVEMDHAPAVVTHHDKGEEYAERRCWNGEEVNRDDVSNMIVEEGTPSL